MIKTANTSNCSIWLKPMIKCMDKIIDCTRPKRIKYCEIQTGNIISLKLQNGEQTYVATGDWDETAHAGRFLNLHGNQVVLSERIIQCMKISKIGTLKG